MSSEPLRGDASPASRRKEGRKGGGIKGRSPGVGGRGAATCMSSSNFRRTRRRDGR